MKLIKDYMNQTAERHALNELTRETFGFDFEGWVTEGYYEGDYIPYSYEENGKLIANVSANRMKFIQNGQDKFYIQLGTVMTKKEFRNQGYARKLMEEVMAEYASKCDGIYLFGDLDALDFYSKMGFSIVNQYQYILSQDVQVAIKKNKKNYDDSDVFQPISQMSEVCKMDQKMKYMEAVRTSVANSAFEQKNKFGLQMFYTAGVDSVYYCKTLDCYIVLDKEDDVLYLQSVICNRQLSLEDVLARIPEDYSKLILGFTPQESDKHLFTAQVYDGGDDYRLFIYGEDLKRIETDKLYFPQLSHA